MSVRGLALMIVNSFKDEGEGEGTKGEGKGEGKDEKIDEREGAKLDYEGMKDLFENLDFEVKYLKDLKFDDLETRLGEIKETSTIANPECFVCVVSSHGAELEMESRNKGKKEPSDKEPIILSPAFYTSDSLPYYVNTLVERFSNWDAYAGKPKLFFIQAYRSGSRDFNPLDGGKLLEVIKDIESPVSIANKEDDAMDGTKCRDIPDSKANKPGAAGDTSVIECPEDCLIMFPVVSGRYAIHNTKFGSWMLRYMYEREENKLMDNLIADGRLMPFLTGVADAIARKKFHPYKNTTTKCAAYITHRLTDDVLFEPMSDTSKMADARRGLLQ